MATVAVSPTRKSRLNSKYALFGVFAAMSLFVLVHRDLALLDSRSVLRVRYSVIPYWMLAHGIFGALALLLAPFQFSNRLRAKHLQLHRVMGRVYVASVFIGAPTAVVVAFSIGPHVLRLASIVQALGWMITTGTALYCIRTGRIKQHREWMIRSYPFAMVFVVVRTINAIPAIRAMGPEALQSVVWTVIATAGFLPSFVLAWQSMLADRPAARRVVR